MSRPPIRRCRFPTGRQQFAPFAALTGHEAAIRETARLTDEKITLDENAKALLNEKLRMVKELQETQPAISVTYFQPDGKKSGDSMSPSQEG